MLSKLLYTYSNINYCWGYSKVVAFSYVNKNQNIVRLFIYTKSITNFINIYNKFIFLFNYNKRINETIRKKYTIFREKKVKFQLLMCCGMSPRESLREGYIVIWGVKPVFIF